MNFYLLVKICWEVGWLDLEYWKSALLATNQSKTPSVVSCYFWNYLTGLD